MPGLDIIVHAKHQSVAAVLLSTCNQSTFAATAANHLLQLLYNMSQATSAMSTAHHVIQN
jgi:hypothetical protein